MKTKDGPQKGDDMKKYGLILGAFALAALLGFQASASVNIKTNHVTGKVQGIQTEDNDGFVDGALVLPSVKAEAILQFDIQNLLAPSEPMTAGPKTVNVPGNLYFPEQTETYLFFPITIVKDSFSFYPEAGAKDELYALWFRVPFDDLIKMGKDKSPFTEMVPLIKLQKFGFEDLRDWNNQRGISLNINREFTKNVAYTWNRSAAPDNSADVAVAFQKTPAGRWMISDLVGKPAESGNFASAAGMQSEMKVLFLRLTNEGRMPVSAVGHIRKSGTSSDRVEVGELPAPITGATVSRGVNTTTVSWTPIATPGWMAVLRSTGKKLQTEVSLTRRTSSEEAACSFATGIQTLFGSEDSCEAPKNSDLALPASNSTRLEAWVAGNGGKLQLSTPLGNDEKITLIFVGAEKEVPSPAKSVDGAEPALFTYAKELRMIRILK